MAPARRAAAVVTAGAWIVGTLVVALLALRAPVVVVLAGLALAAHAVWGRGRPEEIAEDLWFALDKELILSIPMYLLLGELATRGSFAARLLALMRTSVGFLPGGLALAAVLCCAMFGSVSGSSVATLLAIGTVMLPALLEAGYDRRYASGALMAGGTLGILIPPSIPLLLYAVLTETSVVELFRAAIGPGLLVTGVLCLHALWHHRHRPRSRFDAAAWRLALRRAAWVLPLPVIVLGGLYGGWFGLADSASAAVLYVLLVEGCVHRSLGLAGLKAALWACARLLGMLLPLLALALSLTRLLVEQQPDAGMAEFVRRVVSDATGFLLLVNALLLVAGCVLTMEVAIVLFAPLLVPLAVSYGIDPVLFGIIMVLNLEIGFLTPPVGVNLIVAATAFRQPLAELVRGAAPFVLLLLGCLALVSWQPWISNAFR